MGNLTNQKPIKKALFILGLAWASLVQAQAPHEPDSAAVSTIDGTVNEYNGIAQVFQGYQVESARGK